MCITYIKSVILTFNPGVTVCQNFVLNNNFTYLGYFVCPLDIEPEDYTACCGDSDAQYCCHPLVHACMHPLVKLWVIKIIIMYKHLTLAQRLMPATAITEILTSTILLLQQTKFDLSNLLITTIIPITTITIINQQ